VLTTHFDHLSASSRQQSAIRELAIIHELEKKGISWFSIGDRNWFCDQNRNGEACAKQYIENSSVCDFRDENEQGHFGPSGTYPGHLGLDKRFEPRILQLKTGEQQIEAETLDVGFRSRKLTVGISDYTYSGEFDPESYDLLPFDKQGPVHDKNFASDHYYIGGVFRLK
jgi:hypothetical protein